MRGPFAPAEPPLDAPSHHSPPSPPCLPTSPPFFPSLFLISSRHPDPALAMHDVYDNCMQCCLGQRGRFRVQSRRQRDRSNAHNMPRRTRAFSDHTRLSLTPRNPRRITRARSLPSSVLVFCEVVRQRSDNEVRNFCETESGGKAPPKSATPTRSCARAFRCRERAKKETRKGRRGTLHADARNLLQKERGKTDVNRLSSYRTRYAVLVRNPSREAEERRKDLERTTSPSRNEGAWTLCKVT